MRRWLMLMVGLSFALGSVVFVAAQGTPPAATPGTDPCASPPAATPDADSTPAPGMPVDAAAATPAATLDACATPEASEVTIEMIEMAFVPATVAIPADTPVTFTLVTTGLAIHNFSIDALDVNVDVPPGQTDTVTITAPAGTYEIYCAIPGHTAAGMVGTLTVE